MRIYRKLEGVGQDFGPCALTIGNFDGVHAGHRRIMRRVTELARQHGWKAAVLTFDPHPTKVVAPGRAPKLLTTAEQRCELLDAEGIEEVMVLPFDRDIAKLTPEEFVELILVAKLDARAVLVGDSFRFGNRAAGDTRLLAELGKRFNFVVEIVEEVRLRGQVVSSSLVRRLIEAGEVSRAARLLGRCYALDGAVVHGHGIGARQTVPTLNLDTRAEIIPADGVYITRTRAGASDWPSVTNIGFRPTFGGDQRTIETFLLSPLDGGPPTEIRVEFRKRLRGERKFDSPQELKQQILRDVGRAQSYYRRLAILEK